jgi:hypothetical protein
MELAGYLIYIFGYEFSYLSCTPIYYNYIILVEKLNKSLFKNNKTTKSVYQFMIKR